MQYHEAIANAILKIEDKVSRPVRLRCDLKKKSVRVQVKIRGKWMEMQEILGFENVTHLEIEQFILGAIEDAEDEE